MQATLKSQATESQAALMVSALRHIQASALFALTGAELDLQRTADLCAQATTVKASAAFTPPLPGEAWPEQGGIYAGVVRAEGDVPAHHVVRLAITAEDLTHEQALAFAAKHNANLPNCSEGSLLMANTKTDSDSGWHWLETQCSRHSAWCQYFYGGGQGTTGKDGKFKVALVRRLFL